VSGGTIAFVTGIYDELVNTLAGLNIAALVELKAGLRQGLTLMFAKYNLLFLIVLGLGMVTSVVLLAQVLQLALEAYRPIVWAFFLGVILLSIWLLGRDLPVRTLAMVAPFGVAAGLGIVLVEPFGANQALWVFLLAGSIAVSAWLLPAISGSFVLLLLGLYESVLAALTGPQWDVLLVFLGGCMAGLLLFARLLAVLLRVWRDPLLSLLTGFMAGAVLKLWPWQLSSTPVSPDAYGLATGEPSYLTASVVAVLAGAFVIWMLARFER
jgi:putative membrane protein